ncbi:helix-turn-helix domain-containing protein [Micromonospora endolithica]|uniref:XRE family transcriptional regulator n=1 Tax=Micromonospora endolithica TaxID=230091 RepID=A0A3A9Z7F7_9ACTN|nr:helix-turn-helix transcriptional regulator [Micromonospora endolithica]RKN44218.1 XRE family transcriptional regulator [Micromonospora endolithica]TWJ25681.1 helix-turn-helix protein [Micromonospora endolithica]
MTSAFDPPVTGPTLGRVPIQGLVRRARRIVGLSQKRMARFARVAPSTVARVEAGTLTPSLAVLERLIGAAGLYLVVVDQDGRLVLPMEVWDDTLDGAGRRYPAHLDTILDPEPGEWWADIYGLARPPETYHRCPVDREMRRLLSVWEVRVAQNRAAPRPRNPNIY